MIIAIALLATVSFIASMALVLAAYSRKPEAQLKKRLNDMIRQAEEERAKNPKIKKNATTTFIEATTANEREERNNTLFERMFRPIIKSIEKRAQKFTPKEIKEVLEDKIFRAGKMGIWDVRTLMAFWCLSIVTCTLLALLAIQTSELYAFQRVFVVLLGMFVGAVIPFAVLNSKIRQRQKSIRRQLPEFLDILCVSVQAGLSFDGAVGKMLKRMRGPLIDEFRRAQNDVALGMTHQYALTNLARRCDLEEVYLFTTSVIQAEKLGTSMTRTLQLQADNMRERHRQYIKSEALKAPVKILFPMILFIFPSIFVVLLFPAVLMLMKTLGGG